MTDSAISTGPTTSGSPDIIQVDGVSKRFIVRRDNSLKERIVSLGRFRRHREEFWALRDIDVRIEAGTTVGLIGHNGSGKSTLLKVVGGIVDPTTGSVRRRGRIAALLELGAGFHPDLTGRENVFLNASILGLSREETEDRLDDILSFASIGDFIDTQVKFYSSGMYVRLAFAVAVHTDPDLLLVDEVLAVGDEAFQRKCLDKIKSFQAEGRTIVLVSHSLGTIQELCSRVILLDHGEVVVDGQPREAVSAFRALLEAERVEHLAETSASTGAEIAWIRDTTIRVRGREEGEAVLVGDDLVITVDFETEGVLDDWVCAVQIDNARGQAVYGTTTRNTRSELPPLHGTRRIELTLRDTHFGGGQYFVNVSLMDSTGRHLHDRPQIARFAATTDDRAVGTTWAAPSFRDLG